MRDMDFGAIRVGAFGTYTLRCTDPKLLLKELVGTDGVYDTEELGQVMRSLIQQALADVIGEQKIPALDLLSSYSRLGELMKEKVKVQIDDEYGLDLLSLQIVNINVPESVQKAIDQRSAMGALGSSTLGPAPNMGAFQQFQMGNALGNAGAGGGVGAGMNMGMGLAMAGQMMNQQQQQPMMQAPPPMPQAASWHFGINGQNVGPLTIDVVGQFVKMGQIKADTLAWTPGQAQWMPAAHVPALMGFFQSGGPPPLPGGGPPPLPR
jgi:membrane protease subunit (stomatin/prohibitin family)